MLALRRNVGARLPQLLGLRASQMAFSQMRMYSQRPTPSDHISPEEAYNVLVAQRKNRPLSPDLTIYKPQLTWVLSGLHRITGVALGGALYLYLIGYALLPFAGVTALAPATVAGVFGALPFAVKFGLKYILSLPFTYHSINGLRHLFWDSVTRSLTNPQVILSGKIVIGLSLITSLGMAII